MKFLCVFLLAVTVSMCAAVPCSKAPAVDAATSTTERSKREVNPADAPAEVENTVNNLSKREARNDKEENAEKTGNGRSQNASPPPQKGKGKAKGRKSTTEAA